MNALRREIRTLTVDYQLSLVFFFDGSKSKLKSGTREKRKLQREEKWQNLYNLCLGDYLGAGGGAKELPKPVLAIEALRAVLIEFAIQIVDCEYEADQEIAIACKIANGNNQTTRILWQ